MTSDSITKLSIDQLYVGMTESISKVITSEDVRKFSELSGDTNPIHLDEKYAKKTRYKKILHMALCVHHISLAYLEQNYQVWDLFMFHNL